MATHRKFSLSIPSVFLAIAAVALLFSRDWSFGFLLLVIELFTIYLCVEILTQRMPAALHTLSQDNCYRLDGTLSHRRLSRERRAVRKVRSDLWAVFLAVAFIGTSGVFIIHTQVFPIPLAAEVISAFRDDPADFKGALRQRHVDDKFFRWSRSSSTRTNAQIDQQSRHLWTSWPIVLALALTSLVACLTLIPYTYFRTLREFHHAVSARDGVSQCRYYSPATINCRLQIPLGSHTSKPLR